jgi:hypothetical protein
MKLIDLFINRGQAELPGEPLEEMIFPSLPQHGFTPSNWNGSGSHNRWPLMYLRARSHLFTRT